jgi:hypothetical protein
MSISRCWVVVGLAALVFTTSWQLRIPSLGAPLLSKTMPGDFSANTAAATIDQFSWQSFVAINWPASGNGIIGQGGDAVTSWQFWKRDLDVLVPDGQVPISWQTPSPVPAECTQPAPAGTRILAQDTKLGQLGDFTTPGNGPLIDQNGNYVRFEILVNEAMYDFIVANKLYSVSGQKAFNPSGLLALPSGVHNGAAGAVMLKIAWKVLGPGDDSTRFHTSPAYLYTPGSTPQCQLQQVGLVGMHISHKTANAPQWVWSTFEHMDNAPLAGSGAAGPFSFNDGLAAHQQTTCENSGDCNQVPQLPWDPNTGTSTPVQVARMSDFTATARTANTLFEKALLAVDASSVFANYRLVGTQYPTDPTSANDAAGVPRPAFLANTTMETFLQGTTPVVSSSCASCHSQANMSDGRPSDFSFVLARVGRK